MSELRNRLSESYLQIFEKISNFLLIVTTFVKYFLALIIFIAIVLSFWSLPHQFIMLFDVESESLIEFLKYAINMIIALELIDVLSHKTLDTIVEILLMALTRELIIERMSSPEMLIGIIGIGVLFAIRKYLYVPQLDKIHPNEFTPIHRKHSKPAPEKKEGQPS